MPRGTGRRRRPGRAEPAARAAPADRPDPAIRGVRRLPASHPDLQRVDHERTGDPAARKPGRAGYVNEHSGARHIVPALAPHLFPDSFNRRLSPRVTLGIPVACRFEGTITAARTLDLGKGGLGVWTRIRSLPARRFTCSSGCRPRNAPSRPGRAWSGATGAAAWGSASNRSTPRVRRPSTSSWTGPPRAASSDAWPPLG